MKKNIFFKIIIIILLLSGKIFAQGYKTAGGIRIGQDIGLTVQQHIYNRTSLELLLSTNYRSKDGRVTLLSNFNYNLLGRRIYAFWGLGLHKSFQSSVNNRSFWGIDGIGGLGFTRKRYNFTLDYRPFVNLTSNVNYPILDGYAAVSVRYVFVPMESRFETWKNKQKKKLDKIKTKN